MLTREYGMVLFLDGPELIFALQVSVTRLDLPIRSSLL